MSRNLSDRNNHFTEPVLPGPVVAFRAQRAGVEFNGVVALCSGMSPREKRIAEQALTDRRYGQRTLSTGMTVYVLKPVSAAPSPAQPAADQPKPKLSPGCCARQCQRTGAVLALRSNCCRGTDPPAAPGGRPHGARTAGFGCFPFAADAAGARTLYRFCVRPDHGQRTGAARPCQP